MKPKTIVKLKENTGFESVTGLISFFQNKQNISFTYKPIGIELEITNKCNLRCSGCPIMVDGERTEDVLKDDQIIQVLHQAKGYGMFGYSITGGEPFLKFKTIIKIINSSHGIDLYKLNTNASYFKTPAITNGYLIELKKAGLTSKNKYIKPVIVISLGHQNLAGVPIQNAVNLTANIYSIFNQEEIACSLNITDKNPLLAQKIYEDFKKLYLKNKGQQFNEALFEVRQFSLTNIKTLRRLDLAEKEDIAILTRIEQFKNEYISGGCFNIHIKNMSDKKQAETLIPRIVMKPNGDIYACQGFNYVHNIGNITRKHLSSIIADANKNVILQTVFSKNLEGLYKFAIEHDSKIKNIKVGRRYSPCDVCQLLTRELEKYV